MSPRRVRPARNWRTEGLEPDVRTNIPDPPSMRRFGSHTSIFVADQVVSSLANVIVVFAAARAGDRYEFGAFSVVFGICTLAIGFRAATLGDLALVTAGRGDEYARCSAGLSLYLGIITGSAVSVTALALHLPATFVFVSVAFPLVLLQDAMRYWSFATRTPTQALLLDVIWLVVELLTLGTAGHGVGTAFAAWMLGGAAAAIVGLRYLRPRLQLGRLFRFSRGQSPLLTPYALQFALTTGTTQALTFVVAGLGSVRDAGSLRGAQTLMGPYSIYLSADRVDLVTRLRARDSRRRILARLYMSGLGLTFVAGGIVLVTRLMPDELGQRFLGASWASARMTLPYAAAQVWLIGLAQCFQARLTAALQPNAALRVKIAASVASFAAFGFGYALGAPVLRVALLALIAGSALNLVLTALAAHRVAPLAYFVAAPQAPPDN